LGGQAASPRAAPRFSRAKGEVPQRRGEPEEIPMTTRAIAIAAAASALALPAAALAAPQVAITPAGPVVELSIYESVESAPDRVTIGAGVTTNAPTATGAMRQNAADMTRVIARIKALGIPEKDIQTTGVALGAQYDYTETGPAFRGYQAANRVSIILGKIEDTGRVLDALVEAGATDLSGPAFSLSDETAVKERARNSAVARGEAQAKAYAAMLGYTGVRVLAISETIDGGFPLFETAKMMAEPGPTSSPIQPGQISAGVNVTITYELVGSAANGSK
jgi:uncharacterized protein YggE